MLTLHAQFLVKSFRLAANNARNSAPGVASADDSSHGSQSSSRRHLLLSPNRRHLPGSGKTEAAVGVAVAVAVVVEDEVAVLLPHGRCSRPR